MADLVWRGYTLEQDPEDPTSWRHENEDGFYLGVCDDADQTETPNQRFSALIELCSSFEGEGSTAEAALEDALRQVREHPADMQRWIEQIFPEK